MESTDYMPFMETGTDTIKLINCQNPSWTSSVKTTNKTMDSFSTFTTKDAMFTVGGIDCTQEPHVYTDKIMRLGYGESTWVEMETKLPFPVASVNINVITLAGREVAVISGGKTGNMDWLKICWVFDIERDAITEFPEMNHIRVGHASAYSAPYFYVIDGVVKNPMERINLEDPQQWEDIEIKGSEKFDERSHWGSKMIQTTKVQSTCMDQETSTKYPINMTQFILFGGLKGDNSKAQIISFLSDHSIAVVNQIDFTYTQDGNVIVFDGNLQTEPKYIRNENNLEFCIFDNIHKNFLTICLESERVAVKTISMKTE